jgi:hypothetical protein
MSDEILRLEQVQNTNYINNDIVQDIQSLQELIDTRITNFVPTTSLYAKSSIRFKGSLQFYDTVNQTWFPISSVTIYVTIKDINNNILGEIFGITSSGFFDVGEFETTNFYIPDYYAYTDIVVEAKFKGGVSTGGGTFKPTDYYTVYHILDICHNISPQTGECIAGPYSAKEFSYIPIVAFAAGVVITAVIYESHKHKKKE